jgi:hypothetical protein
VHETAHVLETDVAVPQLLLGEDADSALPRIVVPLEREVHLFDAVALGGGSEGCLRATGGAAVEHAVVGLHGFPSWPNRGA